MPTRTHSSRAQKPNPRFRTPFPPQRDFSSLSVHDLLDAREAYHAHLSTLDNVVATAIGRYRIHERDWFSAHPPSETPPPKNRLHTGPRTLANSVVKPWSWPSVLVFVRDWKLPAQLRKNQLVPSRLYLADGRVVPTCVVLATPDESLPPVVTDVVQGSEMLGGGFLCKRDAQGMPHYGTIACLVQRHGSYFALTSKHVAGSPGDEVQAQVRGRMERIGVVDPLEVAHRPMSAIFPSWPGDRTNIRLDAGLIKIDNVRDWTSQVFGIGEIGDVFDANTQTITLDLINAPVRAFGGTSGVVEGEIQALFYRHQSLGGFDYVTDVLIGPRRKDRPGKSDAPRTKEEREKAEDVALRKPAQRTVITQPGDSGTLWFYDPPHEPDPKHHEDDPISPPTLPERGKRARRLRPIAMQWGAVRVKPFEGETNTFALGAFLSTISTELDVQIDRDWSTGHDEYWGKIGHFAIGWKACDLVTGKLKKLMKANQKNVGFGNQRLGEGRAFKMGAGKFVPMADVPDYVWIGIRQSTEPVQHFADIDIHAIDGGPSMLDACRSDPKNLSAKVWKRYFDGFASKHCGPQEGLLPFRVWQIWKEMVGFLRNRDVERFVAAAGILAHYVGDASQPLHCSYLHHGRLPMVTIAGRKYPVPHSRDESTPYGKYAKTPEAKIHSIYEEGMLEVDAPQALKDLDKSLGQGQAKKAPRSGYEAALLTFDLMRDANDRLPPITIIEADDPTLTAPQRGQKLWNNPKIRKETIRSLAESTRALAALWKGAWREGRGDQIPIADLVTITEGRLKTIPRSSSFLRSLTLTQMVNSGNFEAP